MAVSLCVGDIISLYSEEVYGYVFSQLSSCAHTALQVYPKQDRDKPNLPNPQAATFQVCIQNRYKAQKRYRKAKEASEIDPNNLARKNKASSFKISADAEENDNEQEQKRQHGKPVKYGQVVQLKHLFTNKYIHVSSTQTSATEYSNMLVELLDYNAKNAQFKIMPRYKVKSEGDTVQVDDQIVLESFKSAGQFLHVSKAVFGQRFVNSNTLELNLSVRQSGFTLHRYDSPDIQHTDLIRAGSVFRLFHKELEAYLTAEGVFGAEISEDVHLRVRITDPSHPKTLFPSTSAIVYWQIEAEEGMMKGETMRWEQQCRLRHFTTRKYLRLSGKGSDVQVTLTETASDPKTVFRLHPVIHDMDEIQFESYARIEHVVTGFWLHGLNDMYQSNKSKVWLEEGKKADSMSGLQWDKAALKKITASEAKLYNDAFTIQKVDEELIQIFNFVAGMVPFLQKFIDDKKNGMVVNAKRAQTVLSALEELKNFMIVKGEPIKNRQKLLRNLKILELLVQIAQISYMGTNDEKLMVDIIVACYNVMHTYVIGDSRKNELYIARFIDFFQTQILREGPVGLNAAHMVMELFQDNRKIIDRVTRAQIDAFVELLRKNKNYRYLDLLSVMCVCDGVAIPDNQTYITEAWLVNGKKGSQSCLYLTEVGTSLGKDPDVVYVSTDNGKRWIALPQFTKDVSSEQFLFLDHQLDLFGKLCEGRNDYAINVIAKELKYLTWEEAYNCLQNKNLPDQLRAKYCGLIISLFVDVGVNASILERVKLSYEWDEVQTGKSLEKTVQSVVPDSDLKNVYFSKLSEWINLMLGENTDMTASLIGHNMLVEQVLKLVHTLAKFGYYDKTEDILNLLKPMMSLMDGRNDKPYPNSTLQGGPEVRREVLQHYRSKLRFEQSPEAKAVVDAKYMAMEVVDLFLNFRFNERLDRFIADFKHLYSHTHSIETRKSMLFGGSDLQALLREDFDPEMRDKNHAKKAVSLLREMFKETAYFKGDELTEILLDLSHYKYDKMIQESMYLLNRRYSAYSNLFNRAVQAQHFSIERALDIDIEHWEDLQTTDPTGDVHCPDEEPEERHPMNQTILYNFGVLADIFDIVAQEIDVRLMEQYSGLQAIFKKCFAFLQVMARGNEIVQKRLYDRLDVLLDVKGAEAEMAKALTEVFTGNKTTCLKIRMHQVQKVMHLVSQHLNEVPEFLELLNAIVKVEELNLPIKRNQSYVMKFFMQYRPEVAYIIDQTPEEREKVLLSDESNPDLIYMSALVDVLATCAEGENRFIESICQTIFSLDELLSILSNPNISNKIKKPFARFTLWVYLNTAGGMVDSGAEDMPHDKRFWGIMENMTKEFESLIEYMSNNKSKVKQQLKKAPAKVDPTEDGKNHATLHYIFDGMLPMIQVFFMQFYRIDKEQYPDEPDKVDKLATTVLNFVKVAGELLSNMTHMKTMVSASTALLTASTLDIKVMEDFKAKYTHGGRSQDVRSDAQKKYEDYYKAEEEVNDLLNLFANNYSLSYGGENTVSVQLKKDSDNTREYTEIGGDEELPLGEEFQEHVNCFIYKSSHNSLPIQNLKKKKKKQTESKYELASKLVEELLISGNNPRSTERERLLQEALDVKCLQLLRALIHNEERQLPEDWLNDPKNNEDQLEKIVAVQKELNEHGAMLKVLPLLARTSDSLAREVLAFLSAMLFGGNEDVQSSLIDYFLSTREEHFFMAIKNRMNLSAVATKEKRALQSQHRAKIDEALEQQKSLNKALRHGKVIAETILAGSMMMKRSTAGSKGRLGSRFGSKRGKGGMVGSQRSMNRQKFLQGSRRTLRPQNKVNDIDTAISAGTSGAANGSKKALNSKESIEMGGINNDKVPLIKVDKHDKGASLKDLGDIEFEDLPPEVQKLIEEAEADDLEFKDDGFIELVLRILGQMCDGQHSYLQNYLREQPDNIKSVNLVAETARFLDLLYSNIDDSSIALVEELFTTLNEFASGNHANAMVIFDNKIIEYINYILRDTNMASKIVLEDNKQFLHQLRLSIANLIMSMIEENSAESTLLAEEVKETIDEDAIHEIMLDYYRKAKAASDKSTREDYTVTGFAYYHILMRLQDIDPQINKENLVKVKDDDPSYSIECDKGWEFYAANSMSVELLKDGEVQKVHFRVNDTTVLREEVKEKVKWNINRESQSDKIVDFVDWSKDIMSDIKYQTKVLSYKPAKFFITLTPLWNWSLLLLSFAINIIIVATWIAPADTKTHLFGKEVHEERQSNLETKFFSFTTFYYIVFFGFSIAGTFLYGYFFCFHLLHIVIMNQLLNRVLLAVTLNGKSLLWVFLLGFIIIYIYAIVGFAVLRSHFDTDSGLYCETMFQCLVTSVRFGLIDGLQEYLAIPDTENTFLAYALRAIYDITFYILIITIGLNIIFGIIVDTFSELRDAKWRTDEDMRTLCFICGRGSYDFEHHGKGFRHHVKFEHNMWSYLFFFIHLDDTRSNDYTAIELYVSNMLKEENHEFFPVNRALCLSNDDEDYDTKIDMLMARVDQMIRRNREEDANRRRDELRQKQIQWEKEHRG
uniref:Inositol 1,4,5-trisphosphate receptor n=1 Tax=Saccoglossus kowalevskii TaxID=10224 RepID=A0ABM0MZF2_SACKO|nr:PREDICTED: inositol 1,4,5-trisphosphate receptor type 1-like [Saccoglossus kowalevskii]